MQPLLFVRWRKYDETPLRLKVGVRARPDGPRDIAEQTIGPQKLLVTEAGWAMCLRKTAHGASSIVTITGSQPTILQVLENSTADSLRHALKQLEMPYDGEVGAAFFRCVDVSMTDECAANLRCERSRLAEQVGGPKPLLHIVCDAHKIAAVHAYTFSLIKPWDSRLVRFALSVDGMGLQSLRRELRLVLQEQLAVMYAARPPADATVHRRGIFDLFCGKQTPRETFRRSILESLFNGDIRKVGAVAHYENGCCRSRAHTLSLMVDVGVRCLLPKRFPIMSRSNWTGADLAIEAVGLPASIHGLLGIIYARAFPAMASSGLMGSVAPGNAGAEASVPEAPGCRGQGDPSADSEPPVFGGGVESLSIWREDPASQIEQSQAWIQSGAFADDMVMVQLVYKPQSARMLRQLALTGEKWERRQQADFFTSGKRDYQVCCAASGAEDLRLMAEASAQATEGLRWSLLQERSEEVCLQTFRLSARSGALAFDLLHRRHRTWPCVALPADQRALRARDELRERPPLARWTPSQRGSASVTALTICWATQHGRVGDVGCGLQDGHRDNGTLALQEPTAKPSSSVEPCSGPPFSGRALLRKPVPRACPGDRA